MAKASFYGYLLDIAIKSVYYSFTSYTEYCLLSSFLNVYDQNTVDQ